MTTFHRPVFDFCGGGISCVAEVNAASASVLDINNVLVNPVIVNPTAFTDVHTRHPSPRYVAICTVLHNPLVYRTAVNIALLVRTCYVFPTSLHWS